jgi:hypothetical protein
MDAKDQKRRFWIESTGEDDVFIYSRQRPTLQRVRSETHDGNNPVIQENMADDKPNLGPLLIGINSTAVIIAGITCVLRCYVRLVLIKAFGLDDWLMVVSTVRINKLRCCMQATPTAD